MKNKKDNLSASKGIFFGVLLSLFFWACIGMLLFLAVC